MNYNNDLYSRNRYSKNNNNNNNSNNNNISSNNGDISNNYNSNNTNLFNKQPTYSSNNNSNNNYNNSSFTPVFIINYINQINNNKWVQIVKRIIRKFTNGKFKKLLLVFQVIILFLLLQHTLNKFQRTDDSDSTLIKYRNNLCFNEQEHNENKYLEVFNNKNLQNQFSIDKEILCSSGKQFQFKKFIWIFVDSLAHDQAYDIIESFKENSNIYRVMNHGFKFSTAIYTTFFTGKIPTNYAGKPILSDNIFYQFKRSGNRMHFVGPEFPAPALLGDSPSTHKYFEQFTIVPDETNLFSQLYGNNPQFEIPSEDSVASKLDFLTSGGKKSLMLTTNLLDDKIHRNGKYHTPTLKLLEILTRNMPLIKKWLNDNPDYLFILNSDHGGSKTGGQHEGDLHGSKEGGNEGFFLFYNKQQIKSTTSSSSIASKNSNIEDRHWLDTVDVAPTIIKYFKDVNIPLESLGLVSSSYYSSNNNNNNQESVNYTSTYIDLLANAIQIRELCILKGFPFRESDFEKAISFGTQIQHLQQHQLIEKIEQLKQFIISIKEPMVDFKKFPANYLIFMGILLFVVQVINLKIEISQNSILSLLKNNLLPTVIPYFFIYIDFLFLKFDYHKHFTNVFNYYFIIIPIIIFYIIYNLMWDKLNNNNFDTSNGNNNEESISSSSSINNNEVDIVSQVPLHQVPLLQVPLQIITGDENEQQEQQHPTSNGMVASSAETTSTATVTDANQAQQQIALMIQQQQQQQIQYQQQIIQEQQQVNEMNNINSNFEFEWLNSLAYNIFFIVSIFVASNFIIEFLPMVYEGFQSWSFFINYIILYWLVYVLVILKTQLLSNYISSNTSSNGSTNINISNLLFNNPIKLLSTNQSKVSFLKYGGIYFSMVTCCLLYDISGIPSIMQLCYLIILIQVLALVFLIGSFSDELCLISSLLLFAVSTDNQRFYLLVILLPQLYLLSNVYCGNQSTWKLSLQTVAFGGKLKSLSRMLSLFMIVLTIKSYIFMGGQFNMNVDVRAGNIGLLNMEDYPTFSGFLMVFHKLGYFFILITFLLKFVKSYNNINGNSKQQQQPQQVSTDGNSNYSLFNLYDNLELKSWLFRILAQKSIVLMWIFNFNFWQYKDYLDCFITTLIISIITVGFGVCLCFDELSKFIKPKVWRLINKKNITI